MMCSSRKPVCTYIRTLTLWGEEHLLTEYLGKCTYRQALLNLLVRPTLFEVKQCPSTEPREALTSTADRKCLFFTFTLLCGLLFVPSHLCITSQASLRPPVQHQPNTPSPTPFWKKFAVNDYKSGQKGTGMGDEATANTNWDILPWTAWH